MLKTILRLYTTAMVSNVKGVIPHIYGPPGSGKSAVMEQAAQLLGVKLHTLNVSRISPLDLEGVQMPVDGKLELFLATYWSKLNEGDILYLDEFLRGFPEVYNGLLDIFTSREVAGNKLPRIFIIASSNSVATYDPALEDRLLHIQVPDPRRSKSADMAIRETIVKALGLHPENLTSFYMDTLMCEIHATYSMLDSQRAGMKLNGVDAYKGISPRNLISQGLLRYVDNPSLVNLLNQNNRVAADAREYKYYKVFYTRNDIAGLEDGVEAAMRRIIDSPTFTTEEKRDAQINLQLIESHNAMKGAISE